jgi:hypothetical protein
LRGVGHLLYPSTSNIGKDDNLTPDNDYSRNNSYIADPVIINNLTTEVIKGDTKIDEDHFLLHYNQLTYWNASDTGLFYGPAKVKVYPDKIKMKRYHEYYVINGYPGGLKFPNDVQSYLDLLDDKIDKDKLEEYIQSTRVNRLAILFHYFDCEPFNLLYTPFLSNLYYRIGKKFFGIKDRKRLEKYIDNLDSNTGVINNILYLRTIYDSHQKILNILEEYGFTTLFLEFKQAVFGTLSIRLKRQIVPDLSLLLPLLESYWGKKAPYYFQDDEDKEITEIPVFSSAKVKYDEDNHFLKNVFIKFHEVPADYFTYQKFIIRLNDIRKYYNSNNYDKTKIPFQKPLEQTIIASNRNESKSSFLTLPDSMASLILLENGFLPVNFGGRYYSDRVNFYTVTCRVALVDIPEDNLKLFMTNKAEYEYGKDSLIVVIKEQDKSFKYNAKFLKATYETYVQMGQNLNLQPKLVLPTRANDGTYNYKVSGFSFKLKQLLTAVAFYEFKKLQTPSLPVIDEYHQKLKGIIIKPELLAYNYFLRKLEREELPNVKYIWFSQSDYKTHGLNFTIPYPVLLTFKQEQ